MQLQGWVLLSVAILCSCFALSSALNEEDLLSSVSELQAATAQQRSTREASRKAKKELADAQKVVEDLERQLAEAKTAMKQKQSLYDDALAAEKQAQRAAKLSISKLGAALGPDAGELLGGFENQELGEDAEIEDTETSDTSSGRVLKRSVPHTDSKVILFDRAKHSGRSAEISCCGVVRLKDVLKAAHMVAVRSVKVPAGMKVTLTSSSILESTEGSTADTYSDVDDVDKLFSDYLSTCCSLIEVAAGVVYHEGSSVVLYEEADFQGASAPYLEGDYGRPLISRVGSVRVPAGMSLTVNERPKELQGTRQTFYRDSASFPVAETDPDSKYRRHVKQVSWLSVRRIRPQDMHGLFVFPQEGYHGRSQFFESGHEFYYPASWTPINSLQPSNSTFAVLHFPSSKQVTVNQSVDRAYNATPLVIEVGAYCDPPDFCGAFGTCVAPQQCQCQGSYQGARCHLQMPDVTSAFICDGNAVVIGEPLVCRLLPRRDDSACNATSVFLKVDLNESLESFANITGSPVIKPDGVPKERSTESSSFDFEVVFHKQGLFSDPFVLSILGSVEKVFRPSIEVLDRCDRPGTVANVHCEWSKRSTLGCQMQLRLLTPEGEGNREDKTMMLRCPLSALRVLSPGSSSLDLRTEDGAAASSKFLFDLRPNAHDARRLRVEVQHGMAAQALGLQVLVSVPEAGFEAEAEALLRAGDAHGALRLLDACAAEDVTCQRLRASLLLRLGRLDEAEAASGKDTQVQRHVAAARIKVAAAVSDRERGDHMAELGHLRDVLKLAPLSGKLQEQRSEAAAMAGEFDEAADAARFSRRLGNSGDGGLGALRALGIAFLGLGLPEISLQNLRGCHELEILYGNDEESPCQKMIFLVSHMKNKINTLDSHMWDENWKAATEAATRYLQSFSNAWPSFIRSAWGLHASAVLCQAHIVLNMSQITDNTPAFDEGMVPCITVTQSPAPMQARLVSFELLRCYLGLAVWHLAHDRELRALDAVQFAESLLRDAGTDPRMQEHHVHQLKQLREEIRDRRETKGSSAKDDRQSNATNNNAHEKPQDHYEVLGILRNATLAEIKRAYRKLALRYHPDKNDDPQSVEMFLRIQKAYNVLSEEDLRKRYDSGDTEVDKEVGKKNQKPVQTEVVKVDMKRRVATVWWKDPNTGEEGYMEMDLGEEADETESSNRRPLREHCCLPEPTGQQQKQR